MSSAGRLRTQSACIRCRTKKLKCDSGVPCQRCEIDHVLYVAGTQKDAIKKKIRDYSKSG
ncbi:hypothetical protein EJ08DRAFT_334583 [Tothia fuscella]|uniref:Zn(2)-C6 fungal-type domain-containing protein n=1 Tax=Tothia fuscella TaxID=1048955 RepID=A0A9P4U2X6_9PEZI|nr:hypothetical protein EJ08DRAFT_334583 [Tothia fuscella]